MTLADLGAQALPRSAPEPGATATVVPIASEDRTSARPVRRRIVARRLTVDVLAATAGGGLLINAGPTVLPAAWAVVPVVVAAWVMLIWTGHGYRDRLVDLCRTEVLRVLRAGLQFLVLMAALAWWFLPGLPRGTALGAVAATVGLSAAHRLASASAARWLRASGRRSSRRVLVVGHRRPAERLVEELGRHAECPLDVVGVCPPDPDRIPAQAEALGVEGVIVLPCSHLTPPSTRRLAWRLAEHDRHLLVCPGLTGVRGQRASVAPLAELPLVHVRHTELNSLRRDAVRLCGRATAGLALVVLGPALLLLAIAIRLDSAGPALFRQTRTGQDGVPFTMLKFRTMGSDAATQRQLLDGCNEYDGVLFKIRCDPRVTRIGRLLRRYSIDELPQLINVVRGEMALVGPRPALPEEVERYAPDVHRRLAAAPGITGLWQVSGRSDLDWDESVRLDLSYVDNWTPLLDVRILMRTVTAVFGHRGAY